jgi:integrase
MGRVAKELKALEVGRITKPGYHAVGKVPGLHLQVTLGGARSWVLRLMIGSKRREIGLGAYPAVTLAMAHDKARQARDAVGQGIDPIEQRKALKSELKAKQASSVTFDAAAKAYIEAIESEWRNPKHGKQWTATLATYASPVMGKMLVADIGLPHVLSVLEPIWQSKTETAKRVRGRIESVLDWATTRGYRSGLNPARWKGHLDSVLAAPGKIAKPEHHRALAVADVGAFMAALRQREGTGARALEFCILNASRSGEVRGARWSEFDLDRAIWTIPGSRMKAGRDHRVPLSDDSLSLLEKLPRFADNDLVFVSPRGGPLSDMTLSAVLQRMSVDAVPHGFRSTFRVWAEERTSFPPSVAEMALAHVNGDRVEAAYLRTDLFEKRRRMMADWAAFLSKVEAKAATVTSIRQRVAA